MVLINGDCLEELKKIEDKTVNLILIDPPYNIKKAKWDTWKTVDEYVGFMGEVFKELERVLKDNGSFYFFHNDFLQVAELQYWIRQNTKFVFNSFIIWDKGDFRALSWKNPSKDNNLRSWFNTCEYCLYYTFYGVNEERKEMRRNLTQADFSEIMEYLKTERLKTGMNYKEIDNYLGRKNVYCYFDKPTSHEYRLITKELYSKLQDTGYFKKPYEELENKYKEIRKKYEYLKENYNNRRFTHNLDTNHNNIWISNTRNRGKLHPCEKPQDILERIIRTSSNEGDTVLDCFLGSGSTGVAAVNTKRNFIGIELDKNYFNIAQKRIEEAQHDNI